MFRGTDKTWSNGETMMNVVLARSHQTRLFKDRLSLDQLDQGHRTVERKARGTIQWGSRDEQCPDKGHGVMTAQKGVSIGWCSWYSHSTADWEVDWLGW